MEEQRRLRVMEYFRVLLKGRDVPSQTVETKNLGVIRLHLQ